VPSRGGLLTTIGWALDGKVTYCLEGSVFVGGAVVQWLRDGLGVIAESKDIERLANTVPDAGGVIIVPAFVGLGAPHWDAYARGSVFGITRGTTAGHLARAALESIAFQSRDLLQAMQNDSQIRLQALRVDGGAAVNNTLMQFQADILDTAVHRPKVYETTAAGAAFLAGLAVGLWQDRQQLTHTWALEREFLPSMSDAVRQSLCRRWQRGVQRSLAWEEPAP
jgi:glycerol kinase